MNRIYTQISSILAATALLLTAASAYAQNQKGFSLQSQSDQHTAVNFENPGFLQQDVDINGAVMTKISTVEGVPGLIAGHPELPHYTQSVVIPNEGHSTLNVTYSNYYDIANVEIVPSKGNLYRNINPSDVPYEFGTVYSVDAFYPGTLAELSDPYVLRDYRAQTIITYPFQYNPVTKTLRVYEDIQVTVVNHPDQIGINELTIFSERTTTFNNVYEHHFLNYSALTQPKYSALAEEGSMLIIGPASLASGMDQIVEWKNRSGIACEWVDVGTIGNTDTQIKTYIQDYYASHADLVFVLLVGDHADVKSHTYGTSGSEQLWSDSYYGQMTGDYYPELFVGRYPASNMLDLQTMIDRQMEYEVDPMAGDHYKKALGLGSNEGVGIGDNGEADWQHLRNIRTELMTFGMTEVHEFYDGSHGGQDAAGDPNSSMVSAAVNAGVTLFNYTGHGDQNTCISGNFGSSQINAASNNGKYPFVISVACNNGSFTSGTCISETWLRAKNGSGPLGGIGACGSSILMSWAPPMETQDEMSKILTEQYSANKKTSLGGLFYNSQMSTVDDYGSGGIEVMQTWVFFGDPAVTIRTADPMNMAVIHSGWVDLGETQLLVSCDVDGADITVTQNGTILGKGVSSGGSALITFPALTIDDYLVVTATKYNYRPYQGSVQVGSGPAGIAEDAVAKLKVYPNPATDLAYVSFELTEAANVTVTLSDLAGKTVQILGQKEMAAGVQQFEISTEMLRTGVYFINIQANDTQTIQKLSVIK